MIDKDKLLIIVDEVSDISNSLIWETPASLEPSRHFVWGTLRAISGSFSGTYLAEPAEYRRLFRVLNRETHGGLSDGMPELKAHVKSRIAQRKIDRWERKVAKWINRMPLYEA